LAVVATAIPLGALGRRSEMPVIGYACATFIELWRSLPLIGVLFLAVVMFPLFVPPGFESALIASTLFNAAIFAKCSAAACRRSRMASARRRAASGSATGG
jgi:general L-amino acid transport system permease protein